MSHRIEELALDLVGLLHRNATLEEFSARLARLEASPGGTDEKAAAAATVEMAMAVKRRLEQHESSERGLLALVDSAKDLSSQLDLTSLLNAIVDRARNLLGSHLAWLTVYNEETAQFRVLATAGATSSGTTRMTVSHQYGIAGVVLATQAPFHTPNYLLDQRFPHDAELDDIFRNEGVAGMAGVPLLLNDSVVGLLFVADRYDRTYSASSISILSAMASHAAVAVNNAKAFEQARTALQEADRAREALERYARGVQDSAEAHEQLTSLLARGASLATLVQTVAQLLQGAVLVLDEAFQVIDRASAPGYASKAAENYAPHSDRSAAITQAIRASRQGGRSVIAWREDTEVCRVVAVIGGSDLLGAVLLFRPEDLADIPVRTFERSASVIGIMLLSQERMEASRHSEVAGFLRSLISAHSEARASMPEQARHLGLDLAQSLSLILIETEQPKPDFVARRLRARMPQGVLLDEVDGAVVIVCATARTEEVVQVFSAMAERELGGPYRGILSKPMQWHGAVPGVYGALRRGLSVLRRIGAKGRIIEQNQMALYSVLFESHDRESLKAFINASIGPLVAYDQKRGTQIAETLLNYLDSNQNAKSTASNLGIHVNTVRQRLANVDELLGQWSSSSRVLEIHVALRLRSLTGFDT
ncbi:MAG TPA: GAF domain-containing protein [Noviherbaspirillum sp.]|jgi:sugar diacid utilization regulator/GAF domain-containing protein|uniref:helix-turn-helix domain-containing protein n=1 Tax=Noviherbaspirillum sp. TaxID=1926288 RepID=UPI002F924704